MTRFRLVAQRAIGGVTLANVSEPRRGRLPLPDEIAGPRIVAIARGLGPEHAERIADGLVAGGIRAFEITLDSPGALDALARLVRAWGERLLVGAGTVLDEGSAASAIAAGARFIVSPHTDPALVAWAVARGVPVFPGAFSPTEVLAAWNAGATAVKLFPASVAGPAHIRELRGPFPDVTLVATGGVTITSAPALLAAGAAAVGIGSWLIGDGEPERIAERAAQAIGTCEKR